MKIRLDADIHIHHHHHPEQGGQDNGAVLQEISVGIAQLLQHVYKILEKEDRIMELTAEAQAALGQSLADLAKQILDGVEAAAQKETGEIIEALKRLTTQNGPITREQIQPILDQITGAAGAIVKSASEKVDAISKSSGADAAGGTGTGGTGGDGGPTA